MGAPTYSTGGPDAGGFASYFAPVSRVMSPTPTSTQQAWITERLRLVYRDSCAASFWKTQRAEAALLMVAHEFQVDIKGTAGDGSGVIQSESADEWALSYSPPASVTSSYWGSTPEGRKYLRMRKARMGLQSRVSL